MYSNNIVNFQESTTILNACTKKSVNLLKAPRKYLSDLTGDTGCSPEGLPEAMNDRERWREMVRDIRAGGTTR